MSNAIPVNPGTPVEWIWSTNLDAPVRIQSFAGLDLTFPPDPRFVTPEGRARRLEWIMDPTVVTQLTTAPYNQPGQPPCFQVANDLLQASRQEMFRGQVEAAMQGRYVTQDELQAAVDTRVKRAVDTALEPIRLALKDLLKQAAPRPRGRPPGKGASDTMDADLHEAEESS